MFNRKQKSNPIKKCVLKEDFGNSVLISKRFVFFLYLYKIHIKNICINNYVKQIHSMHIETYILK